MADHISNYNCDVMVFVKMVPITESGSKIMCPHFNFASPCENRATQTAILGNHRSSTCQDADHIEEAMLEVGQNFIDEMMDVYGNVPEWRSAD